MLTEVSPSSNAHARAKFEESVPLRIFYFLAIGSGSPMRLFVHAVKGRVKRAGRLARPELRGSSLNRDAAA
jgi:hypothetical protein